MEDRIQLLLKNPREAVTRPWGRRPEVFDQYLTHVLSIVDSDPRAGKGPVKAILLHAPTACQRVQGYGLWAQIHRATGELDTADTAIKDGFFHSEGCPACVADLHRRRAALRRNRRNFAGALQDADEAIRRYLELGHAGHDLYGNGLASSYNFRAGVYLYVGNCVAAIRDEQEALAVLSPRVSPVLYRLVLANLAIALYHSGRRRDLELAEKILKKARRLFQGVRRNSQERAKLDWLTGQVRYQLGEGKACELREMMERALDFFLESGMVPEAVAIASDLMKMKLARRRWGRGSQREAIRQILATLSRGLPKISTEVRVALVRVTRAVDACDMKARERLQAAIDGLRETCGPNTIACLVTW